MIIGGNVMRVLNLPKMGTTILLIIFIVNILLCANTLLLPPKLKGKANVGNPYYFVDKTDHWCGISDYAVCGNNLFILYEPKGVLACYDLNGNYSHSYLIYTKPSGKGQLFVDNQHLYLESREHYLYTFEDGEYISCYKPSSEQLQQFHNKLDDVKKHQAEDGGQYELHGASIWRVDGEISTEIIHRMGWLTIFQDGNQLLIHFACLIIFFIKKLR